MSTGVDPRGPSFLMVGCQRCGTTWVDAALREHPQIFLPAQKQTYFFDRNYERGLAWYLSMFEDAGERHAAVGEVATGYCLPHAAERMARDLPDVRLIMTMRNPVERAWSYYHTLHDDTGRLGFEEALEADPEIFDRGLYADQIEGLLQRYDRENLLLLLYDDLKSDDRAYLRAILGFIGVNENFESSQFGKMKNSAMFSRLRRLVKRTGFGPASKKLSRSPVGEAVRSARKRLGARGYRDMAPEVRARLIERYRPHNERLEQLLGRDLSHWSR